MDESNLPRRLLQKATNCPSLRTLYPIQTPEWTKSLSNIPKYKLKLGMMNTPIHEWNLPNLPHQYHFSIKRDDLTGSALSGNKVRKFEYLFAEMIQRGINHVISPSPSSQSNSSRTAALIAASLGMKCHLILATINEIPSENSLKGNFLLDKLSGAAIYPVVTNGNKVKKEITAKALSLSDHIRETSGEESFIIPTIGSTVSSNFAYIMEFQEMIDQGVLQNYDDIVLASGTGDNGIGLALGNYLTGSKLRIHVLMVSNGDSIEAHQTSTRNICKDFKIDEIDQDKLVDFIDVGLHQADESEIVLKEDKDFIGEICRNTGVLLDPYYGVPAVKGLISEINKNPRRFAGNRILYIHTGGVFSLFDGRMEYLGSD